MTKQVFIDGEAGTTGLQVRDRLANRDDIELLQIDPAQRKDVSARRQLLNDADLVILCLPDDAAREAVALIDNPSVKVIDASSAHRVNPDWAYGFPEMDVQQRDVVTRAKRVSNPGCYPTGAIALVRPLISRGLVKSDASLTVHAVSGYTGGGKGLIEIHESSDEPFVEYGMAMTHKHLPEMHQYSNLSVRPIFCPSVAHYDQGMIVNVPLHPSMLSDKADGPAIRDALADHYDGEAFIHVHPLNDKSQLERDAYLRPDRLNGTNSMDLFVFDNPDHGQVWMMARLDNLGKGASGAAVQNMNLMLGLPEDAGLDAAAF